MKAANALKAIALVLISSLLCSCWEVAAARAAKKRTSQTGLIVGTIEEETGVSDPLGRDQKTFDSQNGDAQDSQK